MNRSVAMTQALARELTTHLVRSDGHEDLCLATYRPSTGRRRTTAILATARLPGTGDRSVHGNASVTGDYVERVALQAAAHGHGLALLHCHPDARGWQPMSRWDRETEASFANLVRELTGHPLVGLTLAGGDRSWSARVWADGVGRNVAATSCDSIRVIGDRFAISWNPALRPPPSKQASQTRTVHSWGEQHQADLARLRILVVGCGSVGLDVAQRLAATGVQHIGVMDPDFVEEKNLDRMPGATAVEALLNIPKVELAEHLLALTATAAHFETAPLMESVCHPDGQATALDYDLIFSCVDRPWPRAVLNTFAYADLIPIIDGGAAVDPLPEGGGLRNVTWRSHVIRPGRPCMICNGQLDPGMVQVDREGRLEDPAYISNLPPEQQLQGQNVAGISVNVTASLLAQFISFVVNPGEQSDPGPVRFTLSDYDLQHLGCDRLPHCSYEADTGVGDDRIDQTEPHKSGQNARTGRKKTPLRILHSANWQFERWLVRLARKRLGSLN
jgi:hypothetical protein